MSLLKLKQLHQDGATHNEIVTYNTSSAMWEPQTLSMPSEQIDVFSVTSSGQVSFTLTQTPQDDLDVRLNVNGALYNLTTDYTVTGSSVTWLNTPFSMSVGDKVKAIYEYGGTIGDATGQVNKEDFIIAVRTFS